MLGVWAANVWVISQTSDRVYFSLNGLPRTDVGLALGTSRYYRDGSPNGYFEARMDAAATLYRSGAVQQLSLSGDHREDSYNEPQFMLEALLDRGIPESALSLDGDGLDTQASMRGAKRDFPTSKITVVSQRFHVYRALYYAQRLQLDAVAYCADDVEGSSSLRLRVREWLARAKACVDAAAILKKSG